MRLMIYALLMLVFFSSEKTKAQTREIASSEWIVGYWVLDSAKTVEAMRVEERNFTTEFEREDKNRIFGSLGTRTFLFSKEGVYLATWGNSIWVAKRKGSWELFKSVLKIQDETISREYRVTGIGDEGMVLEPVELSLGMFQKLYFVKKK